jgi:hypothetical protein
MNLLFVFASGIPFDLRPVATVTLLAAALSLIAGLWVSTYRNSTKAAAVLALGWLALLASFDVPVIRGLDWFGLSLPFMGGFLLVALAAHALRRYWLRLSKS